MYSFATLDRLYFVIIFAVTHPPMIGFGTEGLTSEHRMKHHMWTRAMSDRERGYSILPPTIHTHTNTHPQTRMYTHIHPPTYICTICYATQSTQGISFNYLNDRALKTNGNQSFEQGCTTSVL